MTGHGICLYWNVRGQRIPWKVLERWLWRCLVELIFGQIGLQGEFGVLLKTLTPVKKVTVIWDINVDPICPDMKLFCCNLHDPDSVWGSRTLLPSSDDNNIVSGPDEVASLAEVNGVLDPVVDVLHPVSVALLLVQQWDAASEDLHLSRHLSIPLQMLISITSEREQTTSLHTS